MEEYKRTVRRVTFIGAKDSVTLTTRLNEWMAEHDTQNPRVINIYVNEGFLTAWIEYSRREV